MFVPVIVMIVVCVILLLFHLAHKEMVKDKYRAGRLKGEVDRARRNLIKCGVADEKQREGILLGAWDDAVRFFHTEAEGDEEERMGASIRKFWAVVRDERKIYHEVRQDSESDPR